MDVTYEQQVSGFKKQLKSDSTYKKYKRIVESAKTVDTQGLSKEIEALHNARQIVGLASRKLSARRIIKASQQDQSYRTRIVAILVKTTFVLNNLILAQNGIRSHILSEYSKFLNGRTKDERYKSADAPLEEGARAISELQSLVEIANLIISDIDTAAWSLKLAITALEVATKREIVV